jgi:hypothetical protein
MLLHLFKRVDSFIAIFEYWSAILQTLNIYTYFIVKSTVKER